MKKIIFLMLAIAYSISSIGINNSGDQRIIAEAKRSYKISSDYVYDTDSMLKSVSYIFYGHTDCVEYPSGNDYALSLEHIEDWPKNGIYSNYTIREIFYPLHLYMKYDISMPNKDSMEYIVMPQVTATYSDEELYVMKVCKKIAEYISSEYAGWSNEDLMNAVSEYLREISVYNIKKYDAYSLLKNGEGNCTAYSDCMDIIAKYLYIPCAQVNSIEYNHMWNIFIGSDGNVYQIDATNSYYAEKMGYRWTKFPSYEYPDTEEKLLMYEQRIIELYKGLNNKPTTYIFDDVKDGFTIGKSISKDNSRNNNSDKPDTSKESDVLTLCKGFISNPKDKDLLWELIVALIRIYSEME